MMPLEPIHAPEDFNLIDVLSQRYDSLAEFYRITYKYNDCGPSVGALVHNVQLGEDGWFYCDDLQRFGSFEAMADRGEVIVAVEVSSIVEGCDQTTDTHEVLASECTSADDFWAKWEAAVDDVDNEANDIWQDTHGCDTCRKHWNEDPEFPDAFGEYDTCAVWDECPDCEGGGTCI